MSAYAFAVCLPASLPSARIIRSTSQIRPTHTSTSLSKTGESPPHERVNVCAYASLKALQTQAAEGAAAPALSRRAVRRDRAEPESVEGGQYGGGAPGGRAVDPEAEWGRDGVPCTFCSDDRAQVRCDVWVQDLGNTNFSIHLPRTAFDRHATAEVVLRAVRALGVDARVNDRNDVCVEGYKMSRAPPFTSCVEWAG